MAVTEKTKRQILAASGNQCAVPNCGEQIFDLDHQTILGKIAHIRAASAGGPRFDPDQSNEDRNGFDNLIALCGKHHDLIDDNPGRYPVELLLHWKSEHEARIADQGDRNWVVWPNSIIGTDQDGSQFQMHYWIDRKGRPRIYSKEQLAVAYEMMELFKLVHGVQDFLDGAAQLSDGSQITWVKAEAEKLNAGDYKFIGRFYEIASVLHDITFGEYQIGFAKDGLAKRDQIIEQNREQLAVRAAKLPDNPKITPPKDD